ncbi:MAG: type II secretion system protein GspD [Deltaproteobacteria bacterium]|nr:MAG: type II secretion system protein GspD [Deltaproteobacteria bacterium]
MKTRQQISRWAFILVTLTALISVQAWGEPSPASSTTDADTEKVSIDFNDVDIKVFIKFISETTGKNYVIDNGVKGKVTILSPGKISLAEAEKVFQTVLDVHGFAAVASGDVVKIVRARDARSQNVETFTEKTLEDTEDKIVTQLIPLKYADPDQIKRLFTPLISKDSTMIAYEPTNMLILTDRQSNIHRLMRILNAIDISGMGREISIIPLEFGDAESFVKLLGTVFKKQQAGTKVKSQVGKKIEFVADKRTNTVIALASRMELERIRELIRMLDKEVPRGKERIHVYYLENAKAEEMAKVLQSITSKAAAQRTEKGKPAAPIVSDKVKISSDTATNSLIIMASKDDYTVLEEVIEQLDKARSMVYIECLIMEVNLDKEFNLGAEWTAGDDTATGGRKAAVTGGFGGSGYINTATVLSTASSMATLPAGFSMGMFADTISIQSGENTLTFPTLSAMIQAYKMDKDVNILSTPQILTTDNEKATIYVGENRPYLTKQGTGTSTEGYNNYEYKDVGITLEITPQISQERNVRLTIHQEYTSLNEFATTVDTLPTTLKRTIDTTVVVNDHHTVVIGGLIDNNLSKTEYKVPCLGDIPGLGWLFKTRSMGGSKNNLYMFLTPRIIAAPEEATAIYNQKKGDMDQLNAGAIKMYKGASGDVTAPSSDAAAAPDAGE